jgi:hypothetical protein
LGILIKVRKLWFWFVVWFGGLFALFVCWFVFLFLIFKHWPGTAMASPLNAHEQPPVLSPLFGEDFFPNRREPERRDSGDGSEHDSDDDDVPESSETHDDHDQKLEIRHLASPEKFFIYASSEQSIKSVKLTVASTIKVPIRGFELFHGFQALDENAILGDIIKMGEGFLILRMNGLGGGGVRKTISKEGRKNMMKQTMVEMSSDIHPEVLSLAVVQACC